MLTNYGASVATDPTQFEIAIADIYRELGCGLVEHNKNIAGLQIDVYAEQHTPDGSVVRTAIECKAYSSALGVNETTRACSRLVGLRQNGLIDKAVIVAENGFTQDARTHCGVSHVECFAPSDLSRRLADFSSYLHGMVADYNCLEVATKGAFIHLSAQIDSKMESMPLTDFVDKWVDGPGRVLTVLGEYGAGKTTSCQFIAQNLAKVHLRGNDEGRVPVFVRLRNAGSTFNLRSYLTDFCLNQHELSIRSYSYFEKLNREGKLLLILDGFDEMCTKADPASVFSNLDDILSLAEGRAKILLTCRTSFFRDKAELSPLETGQELQRVLNRHRSYQIVTLQDVSEAQLQEYLCAFYGDEWLGLFERLTARPDLRSLAERPILLNMIVSTIRSEDQVDSLDATSLYERYTDLWIRRDNWRCHLSARERDEISQTLAFELLATNKVSLTHRELSTRLAEYFGTSYGIDTIRQYAHEVQTCSFLVSDLRGSFSFSHRSFAEFFAAKYALVRILSGDLSVLKEELSIEVLNFLAGLAANDKDSARYLWDALRQDDHAAVQHHQSTIRSAATYLLLRIGTDLAEQDLTSVRFPIRANLAQSCLKGTTLSKVVASQVDFGSADLTGATLRSASLSECRFVKTKLTNVDFREAKCYACDFSRSDLTGANFRGANLENSVITPADVKVRALQEIATALVQVFDKLVKLRSRQLKKINPATYRRLEPDEMRSKLQKENAGDFLRDRLQASVEKHERIAQERRIRIESFAEEIAVLNAQLQEEANGAKRTELKKAIGEAKHERRQLARAQRRDRLSHDYFVNEVVKAISKIEQLLAVDDDPTLREQAVRPFVGKAVFSGCKGLSKQQSDWLTRNGAVVHENRLKSMEEE